MPKSAAPKRKLVLSKETLRSITEPKGAPLALVTTQGPETRDCTNLCSDYC